MRDIPGYEGLYQIDATGTVWRRGRALRPGRGRYLSVSLFKHGQKKQYLVHQLVLLAFEGPCPMGQEVRHKNGVGTDNRLENLEYGTRAQNCADKARHGRPHWGETHPRAKLTEQQVRDIRAVTRGINRLGAIYGVSQATIEAIRSRRIWAHC